jgi:hypothetical protein
MEDKKNEWVGDVKVNPCPRCGGAHLMSFTTLSQKSPDYVMAFGQCLVTCQPVVLKLEVF